MKRVTYRAGKYSTIELDDRSRFFLEALPDAVTVRKMKLKLLPGQLIWQFRFPFYIRTLIEAWELSVEILDSILNRVEHCTKAEDLVRCLNEEIKGYLEGWVGENKNKAYDIGFRKLGKHFRTPPINEER